jgi:hypothetical protein
MAIPKHIYNQYVKPTQTVTKPVTQKPAKQSAYTPPQQQQGYYVNQQQINQAQAAAQAQAYAQQQAAAKAQAERQAMLQREQQQKAAAYEAQARAAIEARKQMLADQAQARQDYFNNQANPQFGGMNLQSPMEQNAWSPLLSPEGQGAFSQQPKPPKGYDFFLPSNASMYGAPIPPAGAGYETVSARPTYPGAGMGYQNYYDATGMTQPPYSWMQPGYYMTQQQINTLMGQIGATINPAKQYVNPPGPRGQRGPYTPQDERQWALDRDTNELLQGVTKGYESRLLYGMPMADQVSSGGGGTGYRYPSYGGGGYGYPSYDYTPKEPVKNWYENMLSWNIE